MTLRQEAYALIDSLPNDESVEFFINMIKQFKVTIKASEPSKNESLERKRQAFQRMEEMKKKNPFPKDYDYEKVRREAMEEKYGSFN